MNEFDTTLSMLQSRYKKATLTKKELAYELSLSESTISNRISKGLDLPNYKKLGAEKSSKVVFPIIEVARYLAKVIHIH